MQKNYPDSFAKKNTSFKLTNDNSTPTDKVLAQQSASISHQSDWRKQQAAKELARVQAYKDAQKKKNE